MSIQWNAIFATEDWLKDYVYSALKTFEASELTPYIPKGGSSGITIGIGFDLKKGKPEVRIGVLKAIGLQTDLLKKDSAALSASEKIEVDYINRLLRTVQGNSITDVNGILAERASDQKLLNAMQAENKSYELRSSLYFKDQSEVRIACFEIVKAYSDEVNNKVGTGIAQDPYFVLSRERAALIVVDWLAPSLVPGAEIKAGNRAEAWYTIRYGWKEDGVNNNGWAKRHFFESELFGLYDDPQHVTLNEAKQVYQMLQNHWSRISSREANYGVNISTGAWGPNNQISAANRDYGSILFALDDGMVDTLSDNIKPAWEKLFADLKSKYSKLSNKTAADYNPLDIILETKGLNLSPADLQLERNRNAKVVVGQQGAANRFMSDQSGALFLGTVGHDMYYFRKGAGSLIIDDEDKKGRIIVLDPSDPKKDFSVGNLYKTNPLISEWKSSTGNIKLAQQGSVWKLFLPNEAEALELPNFQSGDFGINLIDVPNTPATTVTIQGDGYGTRRYDAGGNLIWVTANPQPGKADLLYDGLANDRIEAMGGNDLIHAQMGGNDWLMGGAGNDVIASQNFGGAASDKDIIEGGAGSDMLWGGPDSDKVFAENYGEMATLIAAGEVAGAESGKGDLVEGEDGNDFLYGSNRGDAMFGGDGHDLLVGGGGNDAIYGDNDGTSVFNWDSGAGASSSWSFSIQPGGVVFNQVEIVESAAPGDDTIYAGSGNDYVYGGGGDDEIYAGIGTDTVLGEEGNDFIDGGDGNDILAGDAPAVPIAQHGNDYIDGGSGDDQLYGGGGSDDLFGGDGNDTLVGDDVDMTVGSGDDYIDGEAGDDSAWGGDGNDTIFGGDGTDTLYGENGADYLDGEAGDDTLLGGADDDELFGGDGNDWLQGDAGNDYLDGEAGNNTLVGGDGDDTLIVGDGINTIYGDAGNDTIEVGAGNNTIAGGDGDDEIYAGDGNNHVYGDRGNDVIEAGAGADILDGFDGDDCIDGGGGNDDLIGAGGSDELYGGDGDDRLFGDAGNVVLADQGADYMDGGSGNDYIRGYGGDDTLIGGDGGDWLLGEAGNDTLDGGADTDIVSGGDGDDVLDGGAGNDSLAGNEGNDTYLFGIGSGVDSIANGAGDWDRTTDTLEFIGGITVDDLELVKEGFDLRMAIKGTSDAAIIADYFRVEDAKVDQFRFADGTVLTAAELEARGVAVRGTTGNDTLTGAGGNDTLDGGTGNDTLDGSGGADIMMGGPGDDQYIVDNPGDIVIENVNEGEDDHVDSSVSYVLPDNVEEFHLTGTAAIDGVGNSLHNRIFGNDADNVIDGAAGDDVIWGLGGSDTIVGGDGSDEIVGGAGRYTYYENDNDTLYGGAGDDEIFGEYGNDFIDGGDGDDGLHGGVGNDIIYGGAGYDYLMGDGDGWGDLGSDTMHGGDDDDFIDGCGGDDFLYGDNGNDEIRGRDGNDLIDGGLGDDFLYGSVGNDTLLGGVGNDVIGGDEGNDILDSGPGNDSLSGGAGNDIYMLGLGYGQETINNYEYDYDPTLSGTDVIEFGAGITVHDLAMVRDGKNLRVMIEGSTDTLIIQEWFGYEANEYKVDEFRFADGTVLTSAQIDAQFDPSQGSPGDDVMVGGDGNDTLYGYAGNDYFEGRGGDDTLIGGDGNDTLYGYAGNDYFEGGSGGDYLSGGDGNDLLNGGTEDDYMLGGAGDDTYIVDNTGDYVVEQANEGDDTVQSSVSFTLGNDIELLTLTGTSAINGTGNALSNMITGNGGANILSGGAGDDLLYAGAGNDTLYGGDGGDVLYGGAGADSMAGGTGYDLYIVDAAGDSVLENADEGIDKVQSSVSFTLGNNIENLTLTGTSAINGTGNALDNTINGNRAANTLTGGAGNDSLNGGAGADLMTGGTGDDIFYVDDSGDIVTENAGEGTDTVSSRVTYTLGANIENLILTDPTVGAIWGGPAIPTSAVPAPINGTGNMLDNVLTGNGAANVLTGNAGNDILNGGEGNDTLVGGSGNDTYTFNSGYGADTISENDATAGNADTVQFGFNPLDLILNKSGNNLEIQVNNSTDKITVQNWYSGSAYHTEVFKSADGKQLLDTQVDQLIQAMASFCSSNGMTWSQAIQQKPTETQAILATYWQAA